MSIQIVRETHEAPESLQERIKRAGGLNRFGEPNYRVVWGGNRLSWIGGKWTDFDVHGNWLSERTELRLEPKYLPLDRWHVERWVPPETYGSPRAWYAQTIERADGISIPALGPYPSRGEYEHCFAIQDASGNFLALTPAICECVIRAVEHSRAAHWWQKNLALQGREAREEKEWHARADSILNDAAPAFHGQRFVTVAK